MNTLQKRDWKCEQWKYIYDSYGDNDADFAEMVGIDDDRRRENALLICAAPDMLEALRYVIDNVDDEDVVEKCVAAYMKAQGLLMKGNTITAL